MTHNPLSRQFGAKLAKLRDFSELVEDTLVKRVDDLDQDLSTRAAAFSEDDRQEFFEYHADDYYELADELPTILRYAVLTALDTALEVYLNNTCETYAEVHNTQLRLGDLNGRGIERARQYLKKVAGIAFPDFTPTWTTVLRLHEVRNCIIHSDGDVSLSKSELRKWTKSVSGIRITHDGTISLDREFISTASEAYETFAEAFDAACEKLGLWQSVFPVEDA